MARCPKMPKLILAFLLIVGPSACVPPGSSGEPVDPGPTRSFEGSVAIEDGRCCLGGIAGQQISIHVTFLAASPFAQVTQMRIRAGLSAFDEADLSEAEWEAFSTTKTFEYVPPINWTGFYVSAQFRDGSGNLSQVYSDDISVEGMPGITSSPTR